MRSRCQALHMAAAARACAAKPRRARHRRCQSLWLQRLHVDEAVLVWENMCIVRPFRSCRMRESDW